MPPQASDQGLEILIADDDPDMREVMAAFCRSRGWRVATAHDGRSAISAIERAPSQFRIVLTDLYMPGADGFQVLSAVRDVNPGCYVVIVTGYATIDSALEAVRAGAYDYLAKPFALGQLDVVLERICDRMQLERENQELTRQMMGERPAGLDASWRLTAIDERLSRIEDLLRAVTSAS